MHICFCCRTQPFPPELRPEVNRPFKLGGRGELASAAACSGAQYPYRSQGLWGQQVEYSHALSGEGAVLALDGTQEPASRMCVGQQNFCYPPRAAGGEPVRAPRDVGRNELRAASTWGGYYLGLTLVLGGEESASNLRQQSHFSKAEWPAN